MGANGARGGGKTDCGLVWLTDCIKNPRYRALVIRKNADDLSDWVDRASRFYTGLGAKIGYRPAVIVFTSGAIIRTGHLKDDQAYTKYQGHEYQRMLIEELTQIPDEKRYLQLIASCRSTDPELKPQIFCTTNPGGVGHLWVRKRFVDVAPPNTPYLDPIEGRSRIYIPATIDDNPSLTLADPFYVKQLDALKTTDVDLWKAWRLGDWDVFIGQFFQTFLKELHVIKAYTPSHSSRKFGNIDWGFAADFVFHASLVEKITVQDGKPFNRITTYKEIQGNKTKPEDWAKRIVGSVDLDEFMDYYNYGRTHLSYKLKGKWLQDASRSTFSKIKKRFDKGANL